VPRFLCVTLLLLAIGLHPSGQELFNVCVRLDIDHAVASHVLPGVLKAETEGIWRPYGVSVDWSGASDIGAPACGIVLDARLVPHIDEADFPPGRTVLGFASLADTLGTTPIQVSFDATERILGGWQASPSHDHVLARALGRVLAHEMGHVLLGLRSHNPDGLMRAEFRADDLAAAADEPFRLTPFGVGRLASRLHLLSGAVANCAG